MTPSRSGSAPEKDSAVHRGGYHATRRHRDQGNVLDVSVDGVVGRDHEVIVVPDNVIPVDVLVGRTWLILPHVNYYKKGEELVFESSGDVPNFVAIERPERIACVADRTTTDQRQPITTEDVNITPQWPDTKRVELLALLNRYRDGFVMNIYELGCTDVLKMDIVVTPGLDPVNVRPYRISPSDRQTITTILEEWRRAGIISDSDSQYASPVLLVNKSPGDKRLCVDYRRLNAQTVVPPYLMPDVDEQLGALTGGNVFTTLDLSNGFLQIPLVTENVTARFERMPFGQRVRQVHFKN